jgi:hypothetical protein
MVVGGYLLVRPGGAKPGADKVDVKKIHAALADSLDFDEGR